MPLIWLAIISLVAVILAVVLGLGGGLLNFIDKNANVLDGQYLQSIPKDIDRNTLKEMKKTFDQQQSNPIDRATLEKLKKTFDQQQSKP